MRQLKKILSGIIICLVMMLAIHANTKADEVDFSQSSTIKSSSLVNSQELEAGIMLYQYSAEAYNDGIISEERLNDYTISYLDYSYSNMVRVVNWTTGSYDCWTGARATSLAIKYERENPGWKVVGAVNGDFFLISSTSEVKNTSMQEGELYKPSVWQQTETGVLGFKKDGTLIEGRPTISSIMYLETIDDNNNVLETKEFAGVNKTISDTGITLLTRDKNSNLDIDLTGCKVVELTYTVHRFNEEYNDNYDRLFVKGTITNIYTSLGEHSSVNEGTVFLVSKDGSLDDVELGDRMRCQYHLTGDWADVINATGYYAKILDNGTSLFYQSSQNDYNDLVDNIEYVNCRKNRTVLGKRADGTFVLMTIEYRKDGNYGASYYECAEYLKAVGCTDGWLFDGGGSTTMIVGDGNGNFTMVAGGSDGNERSDGNAVLLVVRDPGITPRVVNVDRFSLKITLDENDSIFRDSVYDIKLTIGNTTYDYDGEPITFENLEENTSYQLLVTYKMETDDGVYEGTIKRTVSTMDFDYPTIELSVPQKSTDAAIINYTINYLNNSIVDAVKLHYVLDDNEQIVTLTNNNYLLTNLAANSNYQMYLELIVTDSVSGNQYTTYSDTMQLQTRSSAIPLITSFVITKHEGLKVTFSYSIYDPLSTAVSGVIDYFGITYDIILPEGSITLDDIDITQAPYIFNLVINTENETITSDSITIAMSDTLPPVTTVDASNSKKTKKCGKKSASIILLSIISAVTIFGIFKKKEI